MASIADRAREFVADRLGYSVVPTEQLDTMREEFNRASAIVDDAEELSYHALGYFAGRPLEMVFERRQRLAQRARIAFWQDPLAGRAADLLADFALGNGIPVPRSDEDDVQRVITRAWEDPKNEEVLTSYEAQRATSHTLKTQANLFLAGYSSAGKIRCTWLDADTIRDVVPDPEDELRPLYYIGHRRVFRWNVERDGPDFEELKDGQPRVTYYKHWRNVDEAEREREEAQGLEPLPVIPDEKKDPGDAMVFHVRTNRLERQHFGIPPAARSLRFYSAMNQFTESRVSKALAAAAFVASRVVRGGQNSITKAAGSILQQTGELAQGTWRGEMGQAPQPMDPGQRRPGAPPPPPGSWWASNEGDRLEALDLKSGGGEAMADAQIIRGPIAAAEGFGQHYFGDASNANLATAATLELPATMMILAWQELLEMIYRWFTDRAIEAAVQAGELGGLTERGDHPKKLEELCLSEAEDRAEMERRTGKDLSYKFEMPFPGRRNLPDVVGAISTVMTGMPAFSDNETMLRQLLDFLFGQGLQVTDAAQMIEEIIDEWRKKKAETEAAMRAGGLDPVTGQPIPGGPADPAAGGGGGGGGDPRRTQPNPTDDQVSTYGERRRGTQLGEVDWVPAALRPHVTGFAEDAGELFTELVKKPAAVAAAGPARNGDGP